MAGQPRPPLSVVIPVREGLLEIAAVLEALLPQAEPVGAEVIVVGKLGVVHSPPADPVRLIDLDDDDILVLRRHGLAEARGEVIAIGEDHAVPRPGWCEAVIRAHAERPEPAIVGCLVNATDATVSGRANFLAFAAPWQPPMPVLPPGRPPPSSTLSLKRAALAAAGAQPPGWFEAGLIPALFEAGEMVADERIVVDHHQDHGSVWSVRNAYDSARSSYGFERGRLDPAARRKLARWTIDNIPRRLWREAREATRGERMKAPEAALIASIAVAAGVGGATGTLFGPGRSAERVA